MGTSATLGIRRPDPIRCDVPLPLAASFYPAGFRVEIGTNSPDVLDAAAESWTHCAPEFDCDPIILRVLVQPEGDVSPEPVHRLQGRHYAVVADQHNFAVLDVPTLSGFIQVSEKTAADRAVLRWFYVESLAYLLLAQRYLVPVHAACVALDGAGVMLAGPSGAGKSTLSFACARAGWTFISDDCTWLLPDSPGRIAIGRPRFARFRLDAPSLFPELEGHVSGSHPNGKLSIEVPTASLPEIRTAPRASVECLVFLDRRPGPAEAQPLSPEEAGALLLREMASYGEEVNRMHERAALRVAESRAFRLGYESLDAAVALLKQLVIPS